MNIAQLYRLLINPRARRTESTAIVRNGSRKTIYGCVCGAEHTCATSYRGAVHVAAWRAEHADCMTKAVSRQLALLI